MAAGRRNSRWLCAAGLALSLACQRQAGDAAPHASAPPAEEGKVVAHLNGEPITADELRGGFGGGMRGDPHPALESAVMRRLAAQEAQRRGLDVTKDVREKIDALRREAEAREQALLGNALQGSIAQGLTITEEELRARYEQTKNRYTQPRLRLRRATFATAEEARAEDERLGPQGHLDPAASEEIGPASREQLMGMHLFGLMRMQQPGQRMVVPQSDGKFALVELVEVLPPEPPPFEEVRGRIEGELRAQKAGEAFAKLLQDLRKNAKLEVDEAALAQEAKAQGPPGAGGPSGRPPGHPMR